MLCHTESIEYNDVSYPVTVECSDPVTTEYAITFTSEASSMITVTQIEEYLTSMITTAQVTTGYTVEYVKNSGKIADGTFTCKIKEPLTGTVGQYACQFLQSGEFTLGDEACYITGIAANSNPVCGNLEVCPLGEGNYTVYTMMFWEPISQIAINNEITELAVAAQKLVPFIIYNKTFDDELMYVNLTVFEYEVGSFASVFGMAIEMGQM